MLASPDAVKMREQEKTIVADQAVRMRIMEIALQNNAKPWGGQAGRQGGRRWVALRGQAVAHEWLILKATVFDNYSIGAVKLLPDPLVGPTSNEQSCIYHDGRWCSWRAGCAGLVSA